MEFSAAIFSDSQIIWAAIVSLLFLLAAVWGAPWARLADVEQQHVFLGSCVFITLLWSMQAGVNEYLDFHLLGVTALTLMFGWALALLGVFLVSLAVALAGWEEWTLLPVNFLVSGLFPVTLSWLMLMLIRQLLPRHFFIYVFVNAFLTAGISAMLTALLVVAIMLLNGAMTLSWAQNHFLPYFPLMFFPEAMLNGWLLTLMISFKPHWVYSFDDESYLQGK
ncbi:MAG: energy-coupling factor ABC transporter permease [gamma proteobacterium symbiont of Bathyaustriella thionipta]|nr:energy-coupling factor ABC transporter permease [gamma proteobacterium symbiont of Bathyaustriella thionipta]